MRVVQVINKDNYSFDDCFRILTSIPENGIWWDDHLKLNTSTLVGTSEDFFNGGGIPCSLQVFFEKIASMSTYAKENFKYFYVLSGLVEFKFADLVQWRSSFLNIPFDKKKENLLLGFLKFLELAIEANKQNVNNNFIYKEETAPDDKHSIILDSISNMCSNLSKKKDIDDASKNYNFSATITFLISQSYLSTLKDLSVEKISKMFSIKGKFSLGVGKTAKILPLIDRKSIKDKKQYNSVHSYHLNILDGEIFEDFLEDEDGTLYSVVFRNCADASFGFPQNMEINPNKKYCFIVVSNSYPTKILFEKLFDMDLEGSVNDTLKSLKSSLRWLQSLPDKLDTDESYRDFLLFVLYANLLENTNDIEKERSLLNNLLKELTPVRGKSRESILNKNEYQEMLTAISNRLFTKQRREKSLQAAPCVYQFPYTRSTDLNIFSKLTQDEPLKKYQITHTSSVRVYKSDKFEVYMGNANMTLD